MKRIGFTLAEVLVTLGIIGVVAALTLPTFTAKTQTAKVGPSLSKAVAVFEQATRSVLSRAGSDYLSAAQVCPNGGNSCSDNSRGNFLDDDFFAVNLNDYISGSVVTGGARFEKPEDCAAYSNTLVASDGILYEIYIGATGINSEIASMSAVGYVAIDINGTNGPNKIARDAFFFVLMDDGSLLPYGMTSSVQNFPTTVSYNNQWRAKCPADQVPAETNNESYACTAHIFENNLKVLYK